MTRSDEIRTAVLAAWERCGYRQPSTRWVDRAGEEVTVTVIEPADKWSNPGVTSSSRAIWPSKFGKRKWPGTHAEHFLRVRATWLAETTDPDTLRRFAVVEGALVLGTMRVEAPRSDVRCWAARWVEQGRGVMVVNVAGYIAIADGMSPIRATTLRGAIARLKQRVVA